MSTAEVLEVKGSTVSEQDAAIRHLRHEMDRARNDAEFYKGELELARGAERRAKEAAVIAVQQRFQGLDGLAERIVAWQRVTFPSATPESVSTHLRREAGELFLRPTAAEEMADVFHLLVALAALSGVDLARAVADKFEVNQARRWGAADDEGVIEHVREDEEGFPAGFVDTDPDGGHVG